MFDFIFTKDMRRTLAGQCFIGVLLLGLLLGQTVHAQAVPAPRSAKKAFALSLLVPGLGHRYAQEGHWRGRATAYALVEAGLWTGLFGASWQRTQAIQSYETLAATRADADITGKDRQFFLNLATYRSSEEYLDLQLRNRAWDAVDYVAAPGFQWAWQSEADFLRYRDLREDSESFGRRRSILIAALVANRLIAGISAIRTTNRLNKARAEVDLSLTLAPAAAQTDWPMLNMQLQW